MLVEPEGVGRMVMNGREMAGWLLVDLGVLDDGAARRGSVDHGVAVVRTLPPK